MEKIITISQLKNGAFKFDVGKEPQSIFRLIGILSLCIEHFAKYGYEQEEKKDGK